MSSSLTFPMAADISSLLKKITRRNMLSRDNSSTASKKPETICVRIPYSDHFSCKHPKIISSSHMISICLSIIISLTKPPFYQWLMPNQISPLLHAFRISPASGILFKSSSMRFLFSISSKTIIPSA